MRCNEPQILISILEKAPHLLDIQERAASLIKLENQIYTLLSTPLNQHCKVANYRQGILIIEVNSACWLTRLKYEQLQLLSALRKHGLSGLSSIQIKINPDLKNHVKIPACREKLPSSMTRQSASYIQALAAQAPEKLKKQLIKLANHAK